MDGLNKNNFNNSLSSSPLVSKSSKNKTSFSKTKTNKNDSVEEIKHQIEERQNDINNYESNKKILETKLKQLTEELSKEKEKCEGEKRKLIEEQEEFLQQKKDCQDKISKQIIKLEQILSETPKNNNGSCDINSPYQQILDKIESLKLEYEKCEKENESTNITTYSHVFITQIYETNEYEGNVTVIGDDEWDENNQLIKDCLEYDDSQYAQQCIKAANQTQFASNEERITFLKECTIKYYDNRA